MSKTEKAKKPRSAKQLANDERLRQIAKAKREANKDEEDFVPTEVQEKQAAEAARAVHEDLVDPTPPQGAEVTEVKPNDNTPSPTPQPQVQVDPNLVAAVVTAVLQAQQQFGAQVAQATPDQKFDELEGLQPQRQNKARLGKGGEVQGVVFRYEVDKGYYPDPTQRLLDEPKLARFALRENFIFRWEVDGVEFKKDNITYAEPRFTLELFRRLYDDEGEPTGKAALIARQMAHEDEFTTRIMAMKMGILDQFDDSEEGFRALMNEIRYQRFRTWLMSIFTPAKIETHRKRPIEQNIGGKIVMVYDTETLTDGEAGQEKAAALQTQEGIGKIATPN